MSKFKRCCLGFIAIIVLLTIVSGCGGGKSSKNSEKKVPEYVCDVEGIGKVKGAVASNVGIAVYAIEEKNTIGDQFFQEQAQGKFVIVSLVVSNGQKDAITVDANSFKLVTSDGVEYSHSTDAQTAIAMSRGGKLDSFLRQINPGMVVSVTIPFDIPKNKKLSDLKLEAHGGFAGDKVLLPLAVQKVN